MLYRIQKMLGNEVTLELWSAVHYNEPGKLKELLRDGANVNTTDRVIIMSP